MCSKVCMIGLKLATAALFSPIGMIPDIKMPNKNHM